MNKLETMKSFLRKMTGFENGEPVNCYASPLLKDENARLLDEMESLDLVARISCDGKNFYYQATGAGCLLAGFSITEAKELANVEIDD